MRLSLVVSQSGARNEMTRPSTPIYDGALRVRGRPTQVGGTTDAVPVCAEPTCVVAACVAPGTDLPSSTAIAAGERPW